jgi:hypothetical protein
MRRSRLILMILVVSFFALTQTAMAQGCSICSKTVMQQGEKPARGMNSGIVYLMLTPFVVMGYVGYRWYKSERPADG